MKEIDVKLLVMNCIDWIYYEKKSINSCNLFGFFVIFFFCIVFFLDWVVGGSGDDFLDDDRGGFVLIFFMYVEENVLEYLSIDGFFVLNCEVFFLNFNLEVV